MRTTDDRRRATSSVVRRLSSVVLVVFLAACAAPPEQIQVVAPETEVHLGGRANLPAPWQPLFGNAGPVPSWQTEFTVRDPGDAYWELTIEILGANDRANRIFLNDQPVQPRTMQSRAADPAPYWVRHHFGVPRGILKPGRNVLRIEVGQAVPVLQGAEQIWDDLQFRNISIRRVG